MKQFIVSLALAAMLLLALLSPVAVGHAHALIACPPTAGGLVRSCTGGSIVCVDRHGRVHRWHGHVPTGWHCVAI